ncbi:hypothetical protein [Streptomyces sp. NPDC057909]|uniref:hypothetical protein n=1 Tax=Streptomyces sp. NPDC057909 TaxID=3346277 RepID=UPI0036E398DC
MIIVEQKAVSVELTVEGYVVTCTGTDVVGHGPTEADAWLDFWKGVRVDWQPPKGVSVAAPSGRLPVRRARWLKVRTIRVRDLFG